MDVERAREEVAQVAIWGEHRADAELAAEGRAVAAAVQDFDDHVPPRLPDERKPRHSPRINLRHAFSQRSLRRCLGRFVDTGRFTKNFGRDEK